jgi:3-keto steroid reductase
MLATKGLPRDDEKGLALKDIGIPRLDSIIMNAGIGGWSGLNWPLAVWSVLTDFRHAVTWPAYKIARVGAKICGLDGQYRLHNDDSDKTLGEVFCANLFGHYVLGHELMPLLSKANGRPEGSRGRIIWVSSIEAIAATFVESDFQGLESFVPYESSKRLTDILALTAELPSVQRASETYFASGDVSNSNGEDEKFKTQWDRPGMYLTHPGVCATAIINLNFVLLWLMTAAFYAARLLGSVWHPVRSYSGACAPVWVALAEQETLDSVEHNGTAKAKWGSSTDRWGQVRVRRTEVAGWGWRGRIEAAGSDDQPGRSVDAEDLTAAARDDFEVLGQRCWREMERLRVEWQQAVRSVKKKIDAL